MNEASPVFEQSYRIYLEDTDAGGIVYHANHLKLFERCRRDWLRELGMTSYFYTQHLANMGEPSAHNDGFNPSKASQSTENPTKPTPNLHFVINELSVCYFQPILLDSLVTVTVTSVRPKTASLHLVQEIFENHVRLASATIKLVCVDGQIAGDGKTQLRPAKLPTAFLDVIKVV